MILNPKYIWLYQKPYCCNVTCLLMILYRNGYSLYEQDYLAKYFDVKISKDSKEYFSVDLKTFTSENFDEGLKTIESENIINNFFTEHNIKLQAKATYFKEIIDLKKFIFENLEKNYDLWVEYKLHNIFDLKLIHDGLIESCEDWMITMIDTDPEAESRFKVSIEDLEEALSNKYARETGIIVISKK